MQGHEKKTILSQSDLQCGILFFKFFFIFSFRLLFKNKKIDPIYSSTSSIKLLYPLVPRKHSGVSIFIRIQNDAFFMQSIVRAKR